MAVHDALALGIGEAHPTLKHRFSQLDPQFHGVFWRGAVGVDFHLACGDLIAEVHHGLKQT